MSKVELDLIGIDAICDFTGYSISDIVMDWMRCEDPAPIRRVDEILVANSLQVRAWLTRNNVKLKGVCYYG